MFKRNSTIGKLACYGMVSLFALAFAFLSAPPMALADGLGGGSTPPNDPGDDPPDTTGVGSSMPRTATEASEFSADDGSGGNLYYDIVQFVIELTI